MPEIAMTVFMVMVVVMTVMVAASQGYSIRNASNTMSTPDSTVSHGSA
jgi:hypothetical protein